MNDNRTVEPGVNEKLGAVDEMLAWARGVMEREPDFVIGDNYLRRWRNFVSAHDKGSVGRGCGD